MGFIQLDSDEGCPVPLAPSTILGRHASCTWTIDEPTLPLYWVEIRWFDSGWAWRALGERDGTSGPTQRSAGLPAGWRALRAGSALSLADVAVRVVEDSAPEPFGVDLVTGEVLGHEAVLDLVEARDDGWWPVEAELDLRRSRPLCDGDVIHTAERALRVHPPSELWEPTVPAWLTLLAPSTFVYVDVLDDTVRLTVSSREREVVIQGSFVRAAAPYVAARLEPEGDGWLTLAAAFERWLGLGGNRASKPARIAQDRNKICRGLAGNGVGNATALFETARRANGWVTRVRLSPSQLEFLG